MMALNDILTYTLKTGIKYYGLGELRNIVASDSFGPHFSQAFDNKGIAGTLFNLPAPSSTIHVWSEDTGRRMDCLDDLPYWSFRQAIFHALFEHAIQRFTAHEISSLIRFKGDEELASRIAYFASDADLDEGDSALTDASARSFLHFFRQIDSDGKISLTCSQDGWLCAAWQFPDKRGASIWFINEKEVLFAARSVDGAFVTVNDGSERGTPDEVMAELVRAGLFTWALDSDNFVLLTTSPDTVVSGISPRTECLPRMRFYSDQENLFSLQTGASTLTPQIEMRRLPEFWHHSNKDEISTGLTESSSLMSVGQQTYVATL